MLAIMEKNMKKKHIRITESLCYTEEINTTLYVNYISIKFLKIKEKKMLAQFLAS